MKSRQLTKSTDNKMVSGVIAGICEYFGWGADVVTILRILFLIMAFSSMGGLIFLYIVASWIMPSGYQKGNPYQNQRNQYQNRWDAKADHFEEKMNRKAQKWGEKSRGYEDKWTQGSWNSTSKNRWQNPWESQNQKDRKIKEAEPIHDEKSNEEDWSDF